MTRSYRCVIRLSRSWDVARILPRVTCRCFPGKSAWPARRHPVLRVGLTRSATLGRYSDRVRRGARSRSASEPGVKVDARSERWREHRKKVRSEIVDAAFRAIDRLGPELSLREIAEEAGTAKPKIYRHFTDKSDLFQAVGERLRDMLWAAIFPSINLSSDPAREVIRRSVEQYVRLVDEHPNVIRFLLEGRFAEQSASAVKALNEGREITLAMAEMFDNELRDMQLDAAAL